MIRGIIFDYGGTIDSRGVHWSEIIWNAFCAAQIPVSKDQFRDCYVFAERELARSPHIMPHHNFFDLMLIKVGIELNYLADKDLLPKNFNLNAHTQLVAQHCYESARQAIEEARPTLQALHSQLPMVLVSNFYGNVHSVLADFHLLKYFKTIIESAVVGIRKPNPEIFALGVKALGIEPHETLVIGDSYKKDILPAESLGCEVLWLKGKGWSAEEDAQTHPKIIKKLSEISIAQF